jgi:transcription elongation factor/antiterminator RfaH
MVETDYIRGNDKDNKWYVLYTRSRHEKLVETNLIEKGIEAFTPKVTIKSRWSDRVKLIEEPVFKSYCFARFSPGNARSKKNVLSQKGVVSIVQFNGQSVPVDDSVIHSLKILVNNNLKLDPCPYYKKGDRVIIKRGRLKGVEGYITEKRDKNTMLVISVDAIESSVKCLVPIDFVNPA